MDHQSARKPLLGLVSRELVAEGVTSGAGCLGSDPGADTYSLCVLEQVAYPLFFGFPVCETQVVIKPTS